MLRDMGMIINRRRAYGGKSLPYDVEIEYLQGSGNGTYIDTAAKVLYTTPLDVTARVSFPIIDATRMVFASGTTYYNRAFVISSALYNGTTTWNFALMENHFAGTIVKDQVYDIIAHVENGNSYLVVDGIKIISLTDSFSSNNLTLSMFARHTEQGHDLFANCRIHSLRWSGNGIVQDFIPVRKGNVGYMYDKVSGKRFGNAGTGSFILGPDKLL